MNNNTDMHDFNFFLNDMIDEIFPNTERYQILGGDYFKDVVLDLREDNKSLRYSPYELYMKSFNYEETIEDFIRQWELILQDD